MSEIAAGARPAWRSGLGAGAEAARGAPDARRLLQLALAGIWLLDGVLQYQSFMFSKAFSQMLGGTADGNPASSPARSTGTPGWSSITPCAERYLRDHPAAARHRDRVAAHGAARPGRLDRVGAGRVVVRRGARDGAERQREPGQRRSRCGDHLRAARGAAVAGRPRRDAGALHRGAGGGDSGRPGAVARALAQPGLLRAAAGEPGAAGAERHDRGHGERRARLAGRYRPGRRLARRPPGTGRLDRTCRRSGDHRRRRVPAAACRPRHPDPGHRGGRGDLGVRRGIRRHLGRRGHRPQFGSAAHPAGPHLLAGRAASGRSHRPAPGSGEERTAHHHPRMDPGHLRRAHARGRGGERGPPGRGAPVAAGAPGPPSPTSTSRTC